MLSVEYTIKGKWGKWEICKKLFDLKMVAKFWLKAVSVGNDTLEYVGELSKQSLVPEEKETC